MLTFFTNSLSCIYEDVVSLSKLQIPLGDYVQPPHNRTAFWYSCRNGNLKIAKIILKKGSNINHRDSNGMTPLHICVKYGHFNIANFLIDNHANINIRDNIVKLLIESGADVQIKDNVFFYLLYSLWENIPRGEHYMSKHNDNRRVNE
ncbi:conserved Plasmodium protein, unknown function [Plasmodium ovale wallikeri]|uniref:Uncharacterized protein n=1 Tax=Plasmodium ovale wallikeri TaxID=864142 RepID=A0A1A8YRF2_PLAOA|nr:conserved Plasmodium protein, unknown function [Plasmodium ovale wallikeri]SBT34566.1 conserved Plasmodium protein, unknown function [Plasmodium ovale wallikeri]